MSGPMLLLTITAVLIFSGLLQRVLDRMYLTDKQALLIIGLMLIGTFLPELTIGAVSINIGGAIIPLAVCAYLFVRADQPWERWRSVLGSIMAAAAVYAISTLMPPEAETLPFDPIWLYGPVGGIIAWMLGRSRRCAFICGIVGVILADTASAVAAWSQGYEVPLVLGGAGIADAAVISGVTAVLLCELIGETIERLVRAWCERRNAH